MWPCGLVRALLVQRCGRCLEQSKICKPLQIVGLTCLCSATSRACAMPSPMLAQHWPSAHATPSPKFWDARVGPTPTLLHTSTLLRSSSRNPVALKIGASETALSVTEDAKYFTMQKTATDVVECQECTCFANRAALHCMPDAQNLLLPARSMRRSNLPLVYRIEYVRASSVILRNEPSND